MLHSIHNFIAKFRGITYSFQRSSSRNEIEELFSLFCSYENGTKPTRVGDKGGGYLMPDDMSGNVECLQRRERLCDALRTMVVEFYSLPLSRIPYVLDQIYMPTMRKLLVDFNVVDVHPINSVGTFLHCGTAYPDTLKVTFHRKERAKRSPIQSSSAHHLDRPCNPDLPELSIDHLFLM